MSLTDPMARGHLSEMFSFRKDSVSVGLLRNVIAVSATAIAVFGCTQDPANVGAFDSNGGQTGSTNGATDASGTGPTTEGDADGDGPIFDVMNGSGGSDGGDAGITACKKVDLLFVVDNSLSMEAEQVRLIANFPTFANQIQTQLADVESYHVAVVTTDDFSGATPNLNQDRPSCRTLGASITKSDTGECAPYAEGKPFMTNMDDLGSKFACAGNVGINGSFYEKVGGAIVSAIAPSMNAAGGCNEGFLREDALLVIVILTDEDDADSSQGSPAGWAAAVQAAKGNVEENVVVLSLIWDDGNGNPYNCMGNGNPPDEKYGASIVEFTQYFSNGSVGSLCALDYGPFFSSAISVIDSACDSFTPPG